MEPHEYEAMYELEDQLWWYRGQRKITEALFKRFLPARSDLKILDVGAGSGGSLSQLGRWGEVTAFDFSEMATRFYATRDNRRISTASAAAMPFKDAAFDLVTIFDVFATLTDEDEAMALKETARVLKPGGFVFWREPGHMFLYGPHDRATHVKRRYNRKEFQRRLDRIGMEPLRLSYSNTFLFPVAVARRLLAKVRDDGSMGQSDVQPMPEPLNSVLAWILSAESAFVASRGLPIGLSTLAMARKR
jgi:ubiquinone/menaquinone biosynthesis C-methylase UbiE